MIFSAMVPPDNLDKELELYKRGLFSRFGTVSSLALPVFVPWIGDFPSPGDAVLRRHWRTGGILVRAEGLFLEIQGVRETPAQGSTSPSEEPLPPPLLVPHLFLMDWMGEGFLEPPTLPEPPVLSWQKSSLVCFDLTPAPSGFWWEQVFLKEVSGFPAH